MSNIAPFPTSVSTNPASRRVQRQLVCSQHAQTIARILEAADRALGFPDPNRKPAEYHELAEFIVGQLDTPHRKVAEECGAESTRIHLMDLGYGLPQRTRDQRKDIARRAFRKALVVYQMVCSGHLRAVDILRRDDVRDDSAGSAGA